MFPSSTPQRLVGSFTQSPLFSRSLCLNRPQQLMPSPCVTLSSRRIPLAWCQVSQRQAVALVTSVTSPHCLTFKMRTTKMEQTWSVKSAIYNCNQFLTWILSYHPKVIAKCRSQSPRSLLILATGTRSISVRVLLRPKESRKSRDCRKRTCAGTASSSWKTRLTIAQIGSHPNGPILCLLTLENTKVQKNKGTNLPKLIRIQNKKILVFRICPLSSITKIPAYQTFQEKSNRLISSTAMPMNHQEEVS